MTRVTCHATISLDGFVAGPGQTLDEPMGRGGAQAMHRWHFGAGEPGHEVDARFRDDLLAPRGAYVMGRNMFGPVRGEWGDSDWQGWWGDEPPYHAPVFVLTHHERGPIELQGTTFHFVTGGFDAAFAAATEAAGDLDVAIAGGAATVQQALRADAIDELTLHIAPVTLGAGERLFDGVPPLRLEPAEVGHSPLATHVRYRRAAGSENP